MWRSRRGPSASRSIPGSGSGWSGNAETQTTRSSGSITSHPSGSAEPSDTDRAMIFEPAMIWLITAVDEGRAGATMAWRPTADGAAFLPLPLDLGGTAA